MGGPEPMDNLRDFEMLIQSVEELERQLSAKEEQQAFLAQVIAEKQRLCQQAKEQHEERIRAMARQARKQRGRRSGSLGPSFSAASGGGASFDSTTPAAVQEEEEEEQEEEDEDTMRDMQSAETQGTNTTTLDVELLREALGGAASARLLGEEGQGGEGDADAAAGGVGGTLNERLPVIRKALEERLGLLQDLNKKVAEAAAHMEASPNEAAGGIDLDRLSQEVSAALGPA